jgi:hypothetical protein
LGERSTEDAKVACSIHADGNSFLLDAFFCWPTSNQRQPTKHTNWIELVIRTSVGLSIRTTTATTTVRREQFVGNKAITILPRIGIGDFAAACSIHLLLPLPHQHTPSSCACSRWDWAFGASSWWRIVYGCSRIEIDGACSVGHWLSEPCGLFGRCRLPLSRWQAPPMLALRS